MNQCLVNIGTRIGSFTFRLAVIWKNHPSGDWMEKCGSGNGVFLGMSAMGSMYWHLPWALVHQGRAR